MAEQPLLTGWKELSADMTFELVFWQEVPGVAVSVYAAGHVLCIRR